VIVTFTTARLQKVMSTQKQMRKQFGDDVARRVQGRLSQLEAADSLEDLRHLPGRCHELTGDRAGHLAIDLKHPYRLIFAPAEPIPLKEDGGLDRSGVTSIVISEVVDYH